MSKSHKPLDRSDIISIISLAVALVGVLVSGIFTVIAVQTAQEANRIAREANTLVLDSNTPNINVTSPGRYIEFEVQGCKIARTNRDEYGVIGSIHWPASIVVSNLGGRSVSLVEVDIDAVVEAGVGENSSVTYASSFQGSGGIWEEQTPVKLPVEILPGTSRRWELSAVVGFDGYFWRWSQADFRQVLEAATTSVYRADWTLTFGNGHSEVIGARAAADLREEAQILPDCIELRNELRKNEGI